MDSGETAAARVDPPHDDKTTLPPEEPAVATPPVPLGGVPDPDPRSSDNDDTDAVLSNEGEELADEPLGGYEDDGLYDIDDSDSDNSDSAFDEDDGPWLDQFLDSEAGSSNDDLILAPVDLLGAPARFASVESAAGFMLLRAGYAGPGVGGEIIVRYVRLLREESGGPSDNVDTRAWMCPVRFLVPSHAAAAHPACSLRLVGAALAGMVCSRRFDAQLQVLWSNLVAAAPVRVPPHATLVEVTVSVCILRPWDRMPKRMASIRAALEDMALEAEAWPFPRNVGMVLQLPAPVCVKEREESAARPAKRRKFADEECAICFEVLERGLVAWPRCSHVFHGGCLEQLLVRGDQRCPLCRSELNAKAPG